MTFPTREEMGVYDGRGMRAAIASDAAKQHDIFCDLVAGMSDATWQRLAVIFFTQANLAACRWFQLQATK